MEQKITIPEGYELQKISDSEYKIVKKEVKLPESWSEFCETHPVKEGEAWIDYTSEIVCGEGTDTEGRDNELDKNVLPNKAYAEAILALCQLIQLRDCYRQGWKPDFSITDSKWCVSFLGNHLNVTYNVHDNTIFAFQNKKLADKFYNNFKDLIEKTKPLFM